MIVYVYTVQVCICLDFWVFYIFSQSQQNVIRLIPVPPAKHSYLFTAFTT